MADLLYTIQWLLPFVSFLEASVVRSLQYVALVLSICPPQKIFIFLVIVCANTTSVSSLKPTLKAS